MTSVDRRPNLTPYTEEELRSPCLISENYWHGLVAKYAGLPLFFAFDDLGAEILKNWPNSNKEQAQICGDFLLSHGRNICEAYKFERNGERDRSQRIFQFTQGQISAAKLLLPPVTRDYVVEAAHFMSEFVDRFTKARWMTRFD